MPTQIELVKELAADSRDWHEQYPWFSLGQLIHVSNIKHEDDFKLAASTGAIFFNDIQRFHWLLNEGPFNKNEILSGLNVPISTEGMQTTPQPFPKKEQPQAIIPPKELIAVAAVEEGATNFITITNKDNSVVEDVVMHNHPEDLTEKQLHQKSEEKEPIELQKLEAPNVYEQQHEEIGLYEKPIAEPEIVNEATIIEAEQQVFDSSVVENITGQNESQPIETPESTANQTKAQQNIKAVLDAGDAMDITFEPYHTIDYFASQGIKVDTKIDDRLGKQLKSFTSWLKSMKRLPMANDAATNAQVVAIQDKSLENTNVITEAMAAVLVKQGKKDQAVEIFKQLSLLHPEKSRYFAAQIEQLKN